MASGSLSLWLLDQEARALLTRLDRVKPFVLQETMLPAAALSPAALLGIERFLHHGRRRLRRQIHAYLRWLRGPGRSATPERQQRGFTFLRLRFNLVLTQLDLFSDVVTQRSEHETGVWLSGLDVAAQDALRIDGNYFTPLPIVCHLHRGMGGAIRRARTRLPGGGSNPVAIIRIPRERMIGFGIASTLVHEVGHQAVALLDLLPSLRPAIQAAARGQAGADAAAWRLWERWISEIAADLWSIARVGVASTMGLMALVSLPRAFAFRITRDDPHPFPWIRVQLSCAIGAALYPDPQWARIARLWAEFYPPERLRPSERELVRGLMATMPAFVDLLLAHRPPALRGKALGEVVYLHDREPRALEAVYRTWRSDPRSIRRTAPSLAFAATGQARARGLLSPEAEDRILGRLITYWALDSTMRDTARSVTAMAPAQATGGWVPGAPLAPIPWGDTSLAIGAGRRRGSRVVRPRGAPGRRSRLRPAERAVREPRRSGMPATGRRR